MLFNFFFKKNNKKKYKHVISIGCNCENAYRFFQRYKFVESSLFTWANSVNINILFNALSNLDNILFNAPEKASVMWKCPDTNIYFHGTEPMEMNINPNNYTAEDYEPFANELKSRVNHLKEKFLSQLRDDKKTLIMYTYHTKDSEDVIVENIRTLNDKIKTLGGNNCELLVILESKNKLNENFDNDKNIYLRYVEQFAPCENVTTKKYDKKSWDKIFNEFKPDFKLKKNKKFKFEEL